jgi:hypothetical protein
MGRDRKKETSMWETHSLVASRMHIQPWTFPSTEPNLLKDKGFKCLYRVVIRAPMNEIAQGVGDLQHWAQIEVYQHLRWEEK